MYWRTPSTSLNDAQQATGPVRTLASTIFTSCVRASWYAKNRNQELSMPQGFNPPLSSSRPLGLFWFGSLSVRACVSSRWDDLATVVINFAKRLLGHLRRGAHGSLDGFKVGLRARCWNHSETEAMVIPWVLDQTIVAMLSSLLPFYVQSLAIRGMGPRWP